MTDTLTLDRLNSIMNKAGIDDHEIIGGVEFSHLGYQKLAAKMGVDLKGIQIMINSLMEKLRKEQHNMAESYDDMLNEDERFSMEKDFLGNVTIRDNASGNESFLRGTEAAELAHALASGADQQETLAHYMPSGGSLTEADEPDENSYEPEIATSRGTYNFPWKTAKGHGLATAVYSGKNKIDIVSIRDDEGDEIPKTPDLDAELLKQAIAFIGDA